MNWRRLMNLWGLEMRPEHEIGGAILTLGFFILFLATVLMIWFHPDSQMYDTPATSDAPVKCKETDDGEG